MALPDSFSTTELDIEKFKNILIALGAGGLAGLAMGAAIKYTAKRVLIAIGTVLIFLQVAQFVGFVDVRWDRIKETALPIFDVNEDGVLDEDDMRYIVQNAVDLAPEILTQGLPSLSGFASGLGIAFWLF